AADADPPGGDGGRQGVVRGDLRGVRTAPGLGARVPRGARQVLRAGRGPEGGGGAGGPGGVRRGRLPAAGEPDEGGAGEGSYPVSRIRWPVASSLGTSTIQPNVSGSVPCW